MAIEDRTNPMQGVSGPGAFSKRTDLQYKPDQYGQGVQMQQEMSGAPLATTPGVQTEAPSTFRRNLERANAAQGGGTQATAGGLFDPTARPNEPITHGVDIGPGAGSNALMMQDNTPAEYQDAYQLFNQLAANPNASPTMKYLAQRIQQGF
jgi:hypothetical protein